MKGKNSKVFKKCVDIINEKGNVPIRVVGRKRDDKTFLNKSRKVASFRSVDKNGNVSYTKFKLKGKTTIELKEEIKDCRAIIRSNQRILKKRDKKVRI